MSVVNTMLRDLDARGDSNRAARIPVRKIREKRSKAMVPALLTLSVVAALGYAGWQQLNARDADVVTSAPVVVATPIKPPLPAGEGWGEGNGQSALTPGPSPAGRGGNHAGQQIAATVQQVARWSWSNDGFALQLDHAAGLRYGVERVAADTLRITLAQSALATLDIPTPTPDWIESVRVQRDAGQQQVTIKAVSRLEYEIAAQHDDDIVVSAWRDAAAPVTAAAVSTDDAGARDDVTTPVASHQATVPELTAPPVHRPPRVTPTTLTEAQQDARIAAQAATQIRAGDTTVALAQLRAAQQRLSSAPQSAALLATVLMSQQRLGEAQPVLEHALRVSPDDIALRKLQARLLATRGEPAQALAQIDTLQKHNVHDVELLALCASLAQQARDYPRAANYYLQWSRLEPNNGATWYGLALALDAQGAGASAAGAYRQALTLISDTRLRSYATTRLEQLLRAADNDADRFSVAREGDLR